MHSLRHILGLFVTLMGLVYFTGCASAPFTPTALPDTVEPTTEATAFTPNAINLTTLPSADVVDNPCSALLPGTSGVDAFGCPTEIDPFSELTFDDTLHESWYRRFWTGSCEGVNAFCFGGEGWFDRVALVTASLPEAELGIVRVRMWALGRVVGHDWARDNNMNEFFNGDLQRWNDLMNNTENILDTLREIEQEVCTRLSGAALSGFSTSEACSAL